MHVDVGFNKTSKVCKQANRWDVVNEGRHRTWHVFNVLEVCKPWGREISTHKDVMPFASMKILFILAILSSQHSVDKQNFSNICVAMMQICVMPNNMMLNGWQTG